MTCYQSHEKSTEAWAVERAAGFGEELGSVSFVFCVRRNGFLGPEPSVGLFSNPCTPFLFYETALMKKIQMFKKGNKTPCVSVLCVSSLKI